jgi:3-hydroxyacyl-[acyl-carrier-protein] dehydratase
MINGKKVIDNLRQSDGRLSRDAIRNILPYGDDFLFVDEVLNLSETNVRASYRVPESSFLIKAHFPHFPVMPGVLIGEGFAQAGSIVVRYNLEDPMERDVLAYEIDSAFFLSPALPREVIVFDVTLHRMLANLARLSGQASVQERKIFSARMSLVTVDRVSFWATSAKGKLD